MQKETLIKLPQVIAITGISRSGIYAKIKQGKFPKQVKLGERSSAWVEREVYEFIQERINASKPEKMEA